MSELVGMQSELVGMQSELVGMQSELVGKLGFMKLKPAKSTITEKMAAYTFSQDALPMSIENN